MTCYVVRIINDTRQKSTQIKSKDIGALLLPSCLYTISHCTAPYLSSLITSTKWASVFSLMFLNLKGRRADWSKLTPPHLPFSCNISYSEVWLLLSFSSCGGLRSPFWVFGLCPPGAWRTERHMENVSGWEINRRDFMENRLKEIFPSIHWAFTGSHQRIHSTWNPSHLLQDLAIF